MLGRTLLLSIFGVSFGMLAAAGVFTVFVAVGLVPRFAGKTHTAGKVLLYEEMVIFGTLVGAAFSIFPETGKLFASFRSGFPGHHVWWEWLGNTLLAVIGIFSGMFVGSLALAIAEMLDSIPIFTRRIGFRHGIGLAVFSMAAGKLFGSLVYFLIRLYRVV